jgi:hypothetical protein
MDPRSRTARAVALTFAGVLAGLTWSRGTLAAAAPALTPVESSGGGHIATASLGNQPSAQAAAVAMLRAIHQLFGARPAVVSVAENSGAHAVTLVFTDTENGTPITGVSMISAAVGSSASGTVLYDATTRFPQTIGSMLQRFGTVEHTQITGPKPEPLAPPEPLIKHEFQDQTGSISLPADWTLRGGGGGSAVAVGPTGKEIVNFNFTQGALEPSSIMGQMLENGTGIYPNGPLRENGLKSIVLLHYSGDPVDAWTKSWAQSARQAGRSISPSFVVRNVRRTSSHSAFVSGTGTYGGTTTPFTYLAYLNISPPPRATGQWGMYFTYVIVPVSEIAKETATASAILSSVTIDFNLLNGEIAKSAGEFQQQFESEIANDQALDAVRQAGTDASIAQANANADANRGAAVAMQHYVLGTSVVSHNGVHSVPIDSDYAAALVQANPNYQIVPPGGLIKGVDY